MKKSVRRICLYGGPGVGKCHGINTPILMFDGSVRLVQNVKIGDLLMGDDSTPRRVLRLYRGDADLYRIVPTKGDSYVVTGNHLLTLDMPSRIEKCWVYNRSDISVLNFLDCGKTLQCRSKGVRASVAFRDRAVPLDPYLLGIWLGDGDSEGTRITTADAEVVASLEEQARNLGLRCRIVAAKGKATTYDLTRGNIGGRPNLFRSALRDLGLLGNKRVPHIYKVNSRVIRSSVLAGIIDSCGYVHRHRCGAEVTLKSKLLAEDVAFIARSLGLAAYIKPVIKTCTNCKRRDDGSAFSSTYHRVSISGDLHLIPTRIARKRFGLRRINKDPLRHGIRIVPEGKGAYFGFETDGNHRYLLGDFTITHNSTTAAWLFVALRDRKLSVELAHEYVKKFAYKGQPIAGAMQMKCFGKQVEIETEAIEAGVDLVVTDSPLLLQCYYTHSRGESFYTHLLGQSRWVEDQWPSFNIFLDRRGIEYDPKGRYQTFEEAMEVDLSMMDFLNRHKVPYAVVPTLQRETLLATVLDNLPDLTKPPVR